MPMRLAKADYELLAAFRRELRRFLAFSERVAQAAGLPAQQYQALLAIKGYPGREQVTVGELARELLIAHHSASELADRMVGKGLLVRRADERDRRRALLALTADADATLGRLALTHLEELRRVQPSLDRLLERSGHGDPAAAADSSNDHPRSEPSPDPRGSAESQGAEGGRRPGEALDGAPGRP